MLQLNRRQFIKTIAATSAGLGILGPMSLGEHGSVLGATPKPEIQEIPNICTLCVSGCGIKVRVKKTGSVTRAIKIEGNAKHPFNQGKLCARGQSGLHRVYDPQRITQPLVRIEGSKRGEWKYKAVSWSEAYQYMGQKLQENKIQPYEMGAVGGWITCAYYRPFLLAFAISAQIPNILGTPMQPCVMGEHFGVDTVTGNFNVHDEIVSDYDKAKYILAIGSNAAIAGISTGRALRFARGRDAGAKVVVLDPRLSETASKADTWVPIKPGTDLAFMLAVMNVVINQTYYDRDFITAYTNVPFLTVKDHGMAVPLMDIDPKTQAPKTFYVFDQRSGSVKPIPGIFNNSNLLDINGQSIIPALEVPAGTMYQGKPVETVFTALKEMIQPYTPAWAAKITDVPEATIQEVAKDFGTIRPALIEPGWHDGRYKNSIMLRKVAAMLQALIGGIDRPGGWVFVGSLHETMAKLQDYLHHGGDISQYPGMAIPGIMAPQGMLNNFFDNPDFWPHKHASLSYTWSENEFKSGRDGIAFPIFTDAGWTESLDGKITVNGEPYKMRSMLIYQANMVRNSFSAQQWEKFLSHDDMKLVVSIDIGPNDTNAYADVILPDSAYLEKYDALFELNMSHDAGYMTRVPSVPAPSNTKPGLDIFFDMAGMFKAPFVDYLCKFFGWDAAQLKPRIEQAMANKTSPSKALRDFAVELTAQENHISKDDFEAKIAQDGLVITESRDTILAKWAMPEHLPMPTPSGRLEIYSLILAGFNQRYGYRPVWDPLFAFVPPEWKKGLELTAALPDDEFFFSYGKVPVQSHTSTIGNDLLLALTKNRTDEYMGIWINSSRANKLGIKTNDLIKLSNQVTGEVVQGKAYVTEMVRTDTLYMAPAFGVNNKLLAGAGLGTALSSLITSRPEPTVGGARSGEFTIKVSKV